MPSKKTLQPHNEIGGITKPALLRLAHRMGIVRMSGLCYEECRGTLMEFLQEFLQRVVIHTEHERLHTISVNHVYASMWPNKVILTTTEIKECKKKSKDIQTCLTFPLAPFLRLVRSIVTQHKSDMRIGHEASLLIQYYSEMYLLKLLAMAKIDALHAQRLTVEPRDLQLARYNLRMTM